VNGLHRVAAAAFWLGLASTAGAAGNTQLSEAQRQYQQERAHCTSGQSHQDRATCLKEAQAAFQEAKRDALGSTGKGQLTRNAVERCKAQPAADRDACIQRVTGAGASEGSVKGGGVIRRTETTVR
jgi:hypothetical protein